MNSEQKNNSKLAEFLRIQSEARKVRWETVAEHVRMGNYFPMDNSTSADFSPIGGSIPVITEPEVLQPI
jgi:hypothetical protein